MPRGNGAHGNVYKRGGEVNFWSHTTGDGTRAGGTEAACGARKQSCLNATEPKARWRIHQEKNPTPRSVVSFLVPTLGRFRLRWKAESPGCGFRLFTGKAMLADSSGPKGRKNKAKAEGLVHGVTKTKSPKGAAEF